MSYKSEAFNAELLTIKNEAIKQFCIDMLEDAPDYFYETAASSTGKYHPAYALGKGGLVRHTKALVGIANDLLALEQFNFTDDQADCIRVAGILHDAKKHGDDGSPYTVFEHPIIAADWIRNSSSMAVPQKVKDFIASLVSSHMGQWATSNCSSTVLPKPETDCQKFVHMCDYLASRKHLEYLFEEVAPSEPQNPDDYVMPFGKYKGQRLGDIKKIYLILNGYTTIASSEIR